jgi:hypothetical protein
LRGVLLRVVRGRGDGSFLRGSFGITFGRKHGLFAASLLLFKVFR